ncbi:MAG: TIGR02186 family protein [Nitrospirae bacterium]|nr:TIGR02186 family protein [Nitrospirota bacterium]
MLTAIANHDHITIDFFYHGSTVSVRGISDPGVDLVIKITSPEGHQVMKQKGKIAGVLWMNVGQLKFEQTPNFYEVFSTKKVEDILSVEEREKYVIGYPALAKHVDITPVANEEEKTKWFDEFVKFKEGSKVYTTSFGKIDTKLNAEGSQDYYILTDWPYQAQPGDYLVSVYAVKDNKVIEQAQAKVNVEQVGMVKTLATMAQNSPAIYGFLSIGVALGAGVGVSMVFRKGGGSH